MIKKSKNIKGSKDITEKIQVTFNTSQLTFLDKFQGIFGNSRAEVVRYIVANWLFDNVKKDKNK